MENFSENDQKELPLANEESDELSTIFSDPTEHKKTADGVKKKKLLPRILVSMLAVCVLIGATVGVIKLIPEKKADDNSIKTQQIKVLELDVDELKTVTVTNENGTFKFYSEKTEDDSSNSTDTVNWYLEGYDKELIDIFKTSSSAETLSGIVASSEITKLSLAECGLENPLYKTEIVDNKGKSYTYYVGGDSLDKVSGGCYVKLYDSDKIYLVDSSLKDAMKFTALDMGSAGSLTEFNLSDDYSDYKNDDGNITTFDTLTVTSNKLKTPIVIVPNKSDNENLNSILAYSVISPQKRFADEEKPAKLFNAFKEGILASGLYSFDATAASLKAFGLDNPDFTATMKIKDKSLTYKLKLQEDGNYAAIADGDKVIRKISAGSLPFAEYTEEDFYSKWVCINSIDDIKEVTINTPERSYTFGIEANPDEEAEDDYIITYNGTKIDCSSFQDFYQVLIGISCTDYEFDASLKNSPSYSFVFTYNDTKGGENRINFVKSEGGTRYQYSVDGDYMGKVNSSDINKIMSELTKLVG